MGAKPLSGASVDPAGRARRVVLALLLFLPISLYYFSPGIARAFRDPELPDFVADAGVPELLESAPPGGLHGDWAQARGGLSPRKGNDDVEVRLVVPPGEWDRLWVTIFGADDSTWSIGMRRGTKDTVATDSTYRWPSEKRFAADARLRGLGDGWSTMTLILRPQALGRASTGDQPLLRHVQVRASVTRVNHLLPFPGAVGLGLIPALVALLAGLRLGPGNRWVGFLGFACGIVGFLIATRDPQSLEGADLVAMVLTLAAAAGIAWRSTAVPDRRERAAHACLLAFFCLLALHARWGHFEVQRCSPLDPDARGFIEIARKGGSLYATEQSFAPWLREPLLPWLLRLWFAILPSTDASARFFSMLLSVGMVGVVFAASWMLFRKRSLLSAVLVSAAAAGMLAAQPDWADLGPRVLREDLTVLLVGVFLLLREAELSKPWPRTLGLAATACAYVLTRISGVVFALPALAVEAWRGRWKPAAIAAAFALFLLPILPHLAYNYQWRGRHDLMASSTVHTRFYVNYEFQGKPGFPTPAERRRDPYAGDLMTTGQYFRMFSPVEVARRHVVGYWNLLVWRFPRERLFFGHEWLMLPGLLGAWLLLRDRRLWFIIAWTALLLFPFAFIHGTFASWRLGAIATLPVMWVWGLGVVGLVEFAVARRRPT